MIYSKYTVFAGLAAAVLLAVVPPSRAQETPHFIFPEQREIEVRDPARLPKARLSDTPPPATVSDPPTQSRNLSLDDSVRIALENATVIRRLAGLTVTASGKTIYDAAIVNGKIDENRARFDPQVQISNQFGQSTNFIQNNLFPLFPTTFSQAANTYNLSLGVTENTTFGGTASTLFSQSPEMFTGSSLSEENKPAASFTYTQPLLAGAGQTVNLASIVIARIQTENSFFQTKDAVQELVRGTIEAYWNLVAARVEVWARGQQVKQGEEALERAEAALKAGMGNEAEAAQSRASLANFRATLITAQGNVLQREDILRNIMGLPPFDGAVLVPVTPVSTEQFKANWQEMLALAQEHRPDLIELKLVIEADEQQAIIANNLALPQVNASAIYQWNGTTGTTPTGTLTENKDDWGLGVTFAVPVGLRKARAQLRERRLILMQDRANLEQGLHSAAHDLAGSYRNLTTFYQQYLALKTTREAARINLDRQMADYRAGRGTLYVNVLQSITEWGDAVSSEAQALSQYNTELATLEARTGTILETHGVHFLEERFSSIGPLGRLAAEVPYPLDMRPSGNQPHYPAAAAAPAMPAAPAALPAPAAPEK